MIGQPLALCAPYSGDRPFHVSDLARVVAEIELRQVAVQMLLFTVLINAFHSPFEDREETFHRVRVNVASHVFVR